MTRRSRGAQYRPDTVPPAELRLQSDALPNNPTESVPRTELKVWDGGRTRLCVRVVGSPPRYRHGNFGLSSPSRKHTALTRATVLKKWTPPVTSPLMTTDHPP